MSNFTPEVIIEEVKNLISYSISNPEVDNAKFESLHKAIIKQYFDAKKIRIDYEAQTIDLLLPVGNNQHTNLTFECLDLKGFILSCLKSDSNSLHFYENLLVHYNIVRAA
jgi:hypothetical protein